MTDFDTPISDTAGAEAYFRSMGCSHFHMSREYPERYGEYKSLNVSKPQEIEWTEQELESLRLQACSPDTAPKEVWAIHSGMEDLV